MSDETTPTQPYQWVTNLYCPFDETDTAWLDKLADYKIGKPQRAKDRPTALTEEQLNDFNIVGIYTTASALRARNPDKITADMVKRALREEWEPLETQLTKYLDEGAHFVLSRNANLRL